MIKRVYDKTKQFLREQVRIKFSVEYLKHWHDIIEVYSIFKKE